MMMMKMGEKTKLSGHGSGTGFETLLWRRTGARSTVPQQVLGGTAGVSSMEIGRPNGRNDRLDVVDIPGI
jgi:hypothetical protein